jgi:hypothetical protein
MRYCNPKRLAPRTRLETLLLAVGWLCVLPANGETVAMRRADAHAQLAFQAAVRSDYKETGGRADRHDALVLTTHVRRPSPPRRVAASLMIEYSALDDGRDTLLVAGMFTRKKAQWTAAASPFYKTALRTGEGHWHYWGGIRRQVSSRHSFGVELFGSLETQALAKWLLGYTGTISDSVSVSFAVGSGIGDGPDRVARSSIVWRPRR